MSDDEFRLIGTGITPEGWCSKLGSDGKPDDYICDICGYVGPKTDGWYEFTERFNIRKYSLDKEVHSLSWTLCPDCGRGRYITPPIIDPEMIISEEGYIKRRWGEEWPPKKEDTDETGRSRMVDRPEQSLADDRQKSRQAHADDGPPADTQAP